MIYMPNFTFLTVVWFIQMASFLKKQAEPRSDGLAIYAFSFSKSRGSGFCSPQVLVVFTVFTNILIFFNDVLNYDSLFESEGAENPSVLLFLLNSTNAPLGLTQHTLIVTQHFTFGDATFHGV